MGSKGTLKIIYFSNFPNIWLSKSLCTTSPSQALSVPWKPRRAGVAGVCWTSGLFSIPVWGAWGCRRDLKYRDCLIQQSYIWKTYLKTNAFSFSTWTWVYTSHFRSQLLEGWQLLPKKPNEPLWNVFREEEGLSSQLGRDGVLEIEDGEESQLHLSWYWNNYQDFTANRCDLKWKGLENRCQSGDEFSCPEKHLLRL